MEILWLAGMMPLSVKITDQPKISIPWILESKAHWNNMTSASQNMENSIPLTDYQEILEHFKETPMLVSQWSYGVLGQITS